MTNEHPMPGQALGWVEKFTDNSDGSQEFGGPVIPATDLGVANVITSHVLNQPGQHRVLLDIDEKVTVVPSSTPGHSHLYLDVQMPWETLVKLLEALREAGIVQDGFCAGAILQGHTTLRLPWVKKGAPTEFFVNETKVKPKGPSPWHPAIDPEVHPF